MVCLIIACWLLIFSHLPYTIASNYPKPELDKIDLSILGIQINGNWTHWVMMIAPCSFRYFVMDQKPQYAGFW